MSLVAELAAQPGVLAAGEYSYRGDRYSYRGVLDEEQARMASVMCRATTMSVHMEASMLGAFCEDCGLDPSRGWVVRGPRFTVCVFAHVFCFLDNEAGRVNDTLALMRSRLATQDDALV